MPDFRFTEDGFADYLSWQGNRQVMRKINSLLKEISRTPFKGEGKPEPLKHGKGKWSRRITDEHRLVYKFEDDTVTIYQCKGHYDD